MRRLPSLVTAVAVLALFPVSAHADTPPPTPIQNTKVDPAVSILWGRIDPNAGCAQSAAWLARVKGIGGIVDTSLFEAHSPAIADAPEGKDGPGVDIPFIGSFGAGTSTAFTDRPGAVESDALANNPAAKDKIPVPCSAYAESGGGTVDMGLPFIPNPMTTAQNNLPSLSPIGLRATGIYVSALAVPGKPVLLQGGIGSALFSVFGTKVIDVPKVWPRNGGVRIPPDRTQTELASAFTNEQVTTDSRGMPTTHMVNGRPEYFYDPLAISGYVNAFHLSALGTNVADATVGHAAVMRSASPLDIAAGLHVDPSEFTRDMPGVLGAHADCFPCCKIKGGAVPMPGAVPGVRA